MASLEGETIKPFFTHLKIPYHTKSVVAGIQYIVWGDWGVDVEMVDCVNYRPTYTCNLSPN